jgi:streptogramin lyase
VLIVALLNIPALAQQAPAREIPFESVPNVLKLPDNVYLGEAAGVALNSKGHIFVYSRGGHTQLFEFDKDGKFLREIGKDLYGFDFAHVVRIDKDDNIWCVDEGSNMVIEFNPEGRVVMLLGRKWEVPEGRPEQPAPGAPVPRARDNYFNRPTDVAWVRPATSS